MIAYLNGIIAEKHPTTVVIDINGIGYEVIVSLSTSQALPGAGEKAKILTYFHVREDIQLLFGFATEEEKGLFKLLLSVSGIGPKMAITILSGLRSDEFTRAIQNQDIVTLNSISGVGKKTAERILMELKDKISGGPGKGAPAAASHEDDKLSDAILALISLGYNKASAQTALKKAFSQNPDSSVEELIRESLKKI